MFSGYMNEFVLYVFSVNRFHAEVCSLVCYRYEFVGYNLSVNRFTPAAGTSLSDARQLEPTLPPPDIVLSQVSSVHGLTR